ncbi:unnamed protein product [Bursaphelenchus okinawaensis]|uniref:Sulfotransfer_1 domain-containing protein n=1 Tax=Bursaphelenchus okinawaensis TaxID=465554 RepID=A0A811KD02_9BILA|nr:unnamed protein product [Bursaphelenchus okinawaensis]CAG9101325.1 unnamed protein product [Bursaphelenchus okinawaensis]
MCYSTYLIFSQYIISNKGDECVLKSTSNITQKNSRNCHKTCVSENEMLAMNSDPLPEVSSSYDRICEGGDAENCVKPFLPVDNNRQFKDMKTHKIIMCSIPKTGSTLLYAINCLLNDELGFFYNQKKIFGNFDANNCLKNSRWTMEEAAEVHGPEVYDWTKLTVVRDPIDRFLSAFVFACIKGYEKPDKCQHECNGCGYNFTCFVEKEYNMLMRFNRGDYAVSFLLQHTWPQNWWCDMGKYRHVSLFY